MDPKRSPVAESNSVRVSFGSTIGFCEERAVAGGEADENRPKRTSPYKGQLQPGHSLRQMIPDLDTYRSANVLVMQHGQDAPLPTLDQPYRRPVSVSSSLPHGLR